MKRAVKFLVIVVSALVICGCATLENSGQMYSKKSVGADVPARLVIADFDSGSRPNNIGGDFGTWCKDPQDESQFCKAEINTDEKVGKDGYSMKLIYDVDSPEAAYNGFWMKLQEADFRPYGKIAFSIKGSQEEDITNKIKLELKNNKGEVGRSTVSVTDQWQENVLSLDEFSGLTDYSQMTEFVVVFDDRNSRPKTGVIYIDNIYVKK